MVGIYFKTNHMPVRFLIYVAITALTRLLISDIQHDHKADIDQVIITGSILILALSILVVRFASWHYPSVMKEKHAKTSNNLKTLNRKMTSWHKKASISRPFYFTFNELGKCYVLSLLISID